MVAWAEAPVPEVVARLLEARHPSSASVLVELLDDPHGLSLKARREGAEYLLDLRYTRGAAEDADGWMLVADALDALYGELVQSGFDHRALPRGADVEFANAMFSVKVDKRVPRLEALADQLLGEDEEA